MDYLTAAEIADKWKVSSRMVAYYCESGRIEGAVKKGKTWFVPADSPKPLDRRYSRDIIKVKDSQAGDTLAADVAESAVYHTKDIFEHLGLTRETLRYYEEIGLIKPKRGQYSRYREFDLFDMSRLMAIDFYKKRGFSPVAIKGMLEAEQEEYAIKLQQQSDSLQEQIDRLSQMQKRLKETQRFYEEFTENIGKLEIRELPPYYVAERFPSVASFGEYRDKVLRFLNIENEDILSSLVRTLTFDETGYKGSEMYVVKSAGNTAEHEKQKVYLEDGKCLYTTLLADNNDTSVPERMFSLCHAWAKENQAAFRGMVYIFVRMAMLNENADQHIYEVWVPLK